MWLTSPQQLYYFTATIKGTSLNSIKSWRITAHATHVYTQAINEWAVGPGNILMFKMKQLTYIVEINIHDRIISNFPVLDVFVKVACHLARGGTLEVIGKPIEEIKQLTGIKPVVNQKKQSNSG